jgi:hypothetical protein
MSQMNRPTFFHNLPSSLHAGQVDIVFLVDGICMLVDVVIVTPHRLAFMFCIVLWGYNSGEDFIKINTI